MSSSRIEYPRKNPVSRHPRTISETGFFPMSSSRIEYPRKNPVSRHHPQSQKPGFFRYLRLASNIHQSNIEMVIAYYTPYKIV
ncbi:MAG: hypothetical protein EAZ09_20060 [Oscillatoriales cyanobacterium]|nr:MAG: hypothetical protein EAZ09_20060 [Oscillatoriales cyanobacterium]